MKIFSKRKHGRRKVEIRWMAEQLQAMNVKCVKRMPILIAWIGFQMQYHEPKNRPAFPKILLSVFRTAYVRIFRFLTGFFVAVTNQSKINFSIINLVRTECELIFNYTDALHSEDLFCLHLQTSFLIKDSTTLFQKNNAPRVLLSLMPTCPFLNVCCLVGVCFLGFVHSSCSLLFRAATYHQQFQTCHIQRCQPRTYFVRIIWWSTARSAKPTRKVRGACPQTPPEKIYKKQKEAKWCILVSCAEIFLKSSHCIHRWYARTNDTWIHFRIRV